MLRYFIYCNRQETACSRQGADSFIHKHSFFDYFAVLQEQMK